MMGDMDDGRWKIVDTGCGLNWAFFNLGNFFNQFMECVQLLFTEIVIFLGLNAVGFLGAFEVCYLLN
jgi:hypothetical protein